MPSWPGFGGWGSGGGGTSGGGTGGGSSGGLLSPQNLFLLGSSVLGSILNRPKGLTKQQKRTLQSQQQALQQMLAMLTQRVSSPVSIDPAIRGALYGQVAESGVGATNRIQDALARRGLSSSGIAANALTKVAQEQQRAQTGVDLSLWQTALGQRQADEARLLNAIGLPVSPPDTGQSTGAAFFSGLTPMLAYLIRLQQLQKEAGG